MSVIKEAMARRCRSEQAEAKRQTGMPRPPLGFAPQVRALSERVVRVIRVAARECGYAVAVHGSMERDLDLIAIPWTEQAESPTDLIDTIKSALASAVGGCREAGEVGQKPHGRMVWTLLLNRPVVTPTGKFPFIDLGVMPRGALSPLPSAVSESSGEGA